MQVEHLKNYGKDIMTMQREATAPLRKKLRIARAAMSFLASLIAALGASGFLRLIKTCKAEVRKAEQMDWKHLRDNGISEEDLDIVLRKIVFAKVLADLLGIERAAKLRNSFSDKIAYDALEEVFARPEDFVACGNGEFLPPFKQYYVALCEAMAKKGLERGEVVEETADTLQINITYCAWCEVAKALGNPYLCYYSSCYGDEVFFPKFCERVGIEFFRNGTLGTGQAYCDMRFVKKR